MRDDTQRLLDILEAIERIERYAGVDRVDLDEVWSVVHGDLPALKVRVEAILGGLGAGPTSVD